MNIDSVLRSTSILIRAPRGKEVIGCVYLCDIWRIALGLY